MTADNAESRSQPAQEAWQEDGPPRRHDTFVVDLAGFEGPLDLLLELARRQKVDLSRISILQLAEQYLAYIEQARLIRLEIAADYLVMAAWLAYLKSRLLLPGEDGEEAESGEAIAAQLQFQLQRLQAMRESADALMQRTRLGLDVFARGMPEGVRVIRKQTVQCELYELLGAYAVQLDRTNIARLDLKPPPVYAIEEALHRLRSMIGGIPDWASLETFLPSGLQGGFSARSAVASTFAATLEMVRDGKLSIRQSQSFGPIFVKSRSDRDDDREQS